LLPDEHGPTRGRIPRFILTSRLLDRLEQLIGEDRFSLDQAIRLVEVVLPEAYKPGAVPPPTRARPGPEKIALLCDRASRCLALFPSGEPRYDAEAADEDEPAAGYLTPAEAARREPTRGRKRRKWVPPGEAEPLDRG
jgi:hypothetical protein